MVASATAELEENGRDPLVKAHLISFQCFLSGPSSLGKSLKI